MKKTSDYREKRAHKLVSLWDKYRESDGNLRTFWLTANLDQINIGIAPAGFDGTFAKEAVRDSPESFGNAMEESTERKVVCFPLTARGRGFGRIDSIL